MSSQITARVIKGLVILGVGGISVDHRGRRTKFQQVSRDTRSIFIPAGKSTKFVPREMYRRVFFIADRSMNLINQGYALVFEDFVPQKRPDQYCSFAVKHIKTLSLCVCSPKRYSPSLLFHSAFSILIHRCIIACNTV